MNVRKVISTIMFFVLVFSAQTTTFAAENSYSNILSTYSDNNITIYFHNETSENTHNKIVSHFKGENNPSLKPAGLTCTLLGHDLETGSVSTITHKVRTTVPRCLQEHFDYEACSRCDYSEYTLVSSRYINCCA